jgi:hypothetical protein
VDGVCDQAETERARARARGTVSVLDSSSEPEPAAAVVRDGRFEGDAEDVDLVGERSGGGNCTGWERVDTIVFFDFFLQDNVVFFGGFGGNGQGGKGIEYAIAM